MNKAGYTLVEILIVLSILSIIGGISTISYNKYIENFTKQDLHMAGKVFVRSVERCINAVGAWKVKNNLNADIFPCKVLDSTNLKSAFKFTCPAKSDCKPKYNTTSEHYCLFIRTQNHSVVVRINTNNISEYSIFCGNIRFTQGDINIPGFCSKNVPPRLNRIVTGNRNTTAPQCTW